MKLKDLKEWLETLNDKDEYSISLLVSDSRYHDSYRGSNNVVIDVDDKNKEITIESSFYEEL